MAKFVFYKKYRTIGLKNSCSENGQIMGLHGKHHKCIFFMGLTSQTQAYVVAHTDQELWLLMLYSSGKDSCIGIDYSNV